MEELKGIVETLLKFLKRTGQVRNPEGLFGLLVISRLFADRWGLKPPFDERDIQLYIQITQSGEAEFDTVAIKMVESVGKIPTQVNVLQEYERTVKTGSLTGLLRRGRGGED
ncbi:hypothetical protein [Clavavirus yamagawaense]|uniref:Uncharacterized protein n=1 Tax=Aeropyrum pernix bacilliform virus 1 (isolate -/Japan/Tanaka/2005) TaxID=1289471 RepID=D4QF79_APBV1|nr:hypothetical protein FK791_gp13 [Aeropyrum pernix bacilliform virus 1]BAJ06123.1 hypothetical protein [Aeropyrum pernix bacilliform virus 1]